MFDALALLQVIHPCVSGTHYINRIIEDMKNLPTEVLEDVAGFLYQPLGESATSIPGHTAQRMWLIASTRTCRAWALAAQAYLYKLVRLVHKLFMLFTG